MRTFRLPPAIRDLLAARDQLSAHYNEILLARKSTAKLHFTLDGNLVGDIGEAIGVELFGITLVDQKSMQGIDGHEPNGRSVQIKATGTGRGPDFRRTQTRAQHLLFFDLDFFNGSGTVVFNGPEHLAFGLLKGDFTGQRSLTRKQIEDADQKVNSADRLEMHIDGEGRMLPTKLAQGARGC